MIFKNKIVQNSQMKKILLQLYCHAHLCLLTDWDKVFFFLKRRISNGITALYQEIDNIIFL